MGEGFKFAIGEWLQHVSANVMSRTPTEYPTPLLVIGRVWEECPGGVQKHYRVRGYNLQDITVLHEMELEVYQPTEREE